MVQKSLDARAIQWLRDRYFKLHGISSESEGFTMVELLVVIIIIGILSMLALPSFLNQVDKARFAEAKSYIGLMSRLQQSYFLEKQTFVENVADLGLAAQASSTSYSYYAIGGDVNGATSPKQLRQLVTNVALPKTAANRVFVGVVGIPGVVRIDTIFCRANDNNINPVPPGGLDVAGQTMVCPTNFSIFQD